MDAETFGQRVKRSRERAGISQARLAEEIEAMGFGSVSRALVGSWELGTGKRPAPKIVEAIAEICDVPFEFLTEDGFEIIESIVVVITGRTATVTTRDGETEVMDVEEAHRRRLLSDEALAQVLGGQRLSDIRPSKTQPGEESA